MGWSLKVDSSEFPSRLSKAKSDIDIELESLHIHLAKQAEQRGKRSVDRVKSGRARRSVKATGLLDGLTLSGGSRQVPYFKWLDYGGEIRPYPRQSKVIRYLEQGRFIEPTMRKMGTEAEKQYSRLLRTVLEDAGLE